MKTLRAAWKIDYRSGDHHSIAVIAETHTIPEYLPQTFDRLLPDFQNISF